MSKVLIVDDEPKIRRSIRRHLEKEGYKVFEAENGEKCLESVREFSPEVVLLDVMMPIMNGFETCQALRRDFAQEDFFVIMVSAKAKAEEKIQGLDIGADDYISKPFNPQELLARIRSGIRTLEAKRMATIDPLTNLYNRYYFNNFIVDEISRTKRSGTDLSMVLLDIDFFKKINDTYGHSTGDDVLVGMAGILKHNIRQTDVCIRWGGEEFIIILVATGKEGATYFAEKLRETIAAHQFPQVGQVTASMGVATLETDEKDLFERVDKAMYDAKNNGRNRVMVS
jgi:diguanylate cyclase (GGDEF)-like protein